MKKILITGISGTGKTTVCKQLNTLGYTAYDIEDIEGMFKMYRKGTREVFDDFDNADPEKIKNSELICDADQLQKLLDEQKTDVAFYCGVASNMDDIISLFDTFILLKTNANTLHSRLSNREGTDDMGNTEESRQTVLGWKDWWEEEMTDRGAIVVSADGDPNVVAMNVLGFVNVSKT
jgi:broad-specificity NMP kinase